MKIHRFRQYDAEWWEAHRGRASSSVASEIITPAKGEYSKSARKLMYKLIHQEHNPDYGMVESYVSAAMKNGMIMEPEARSFYEMERDCDVEQVGMCETDDGRFICSPDALVGDDGGLEMKSPSGEVHLEYLDHGTLPVEYKPQVHWCLLVTKRAWWDFMSYHRCYPQLLVRVEPDEYTLKLAECMEQFWKEFVALRERIGLDRHRESQIAEAIAASVAERPPQEAYF